MKLLLLLLLTISLAHAEKCRVCLHLDSDNPFLRSLLSPLSSLLTCSPHTAEVECGGATPHCVTAQFTAADESLAAKITIRVAQCAQKYTWRSVYEQLQEKTPGSALANFRVTGVMGDVDVWGDNKGATTHDEM